MRCTFLVKYILKYFIHFGAIVSEILFLILLIYQSTIDFLQIIISSKLAVPFEKN